MHWRQINRSFRRSAGRNREKKDGRCLCDHRRCAFGSWLKWNVELYGKRSNSVWTVCTRRYLYLYTFLTLALVIPRQQCCRPSCNTPVVPFSLHYPGTIIHVMISEVEGATFSLHSLLRETWPLFSQFYENSSIYSFSLSQYFTKFSLFKEYLIEICNKSLRNAVT